MNGIVWGAKHLAREARWFDAAFRALAPHSSARTVACPSEDGGLTH